MTPTEFRNGGAILFETDIAVLDSISTDMMLEVDRTRTPTMESLIASGPREGKILIDSSEASFHFAVMMKDSTQTNTTCLFDNPTYEGYIMANRFRNNHRDLTLYKPMTMMRSMIEFSGAPGSYEVDCSLIPFLRYDIPLDDEKMQYFVQAFEAQYGAMEPVLNKLEGNSFLDLKLFNTYGLSNNYYVGPEENTAALKDSEKRLTNVYVRIRLVISVYDRAMYTQTVQDVTNRVIETFNRLHDTNGEVKLDLHVSDIIHNIMDNVPNVRYVRFNGFNDYDANIQSIFVKYKDVTELDEETLMIHVPEMIRVDADSIEITEEV